MIRTHLSQTLGPVQNLSASVKFTTAPLTNILLSRSHYLPNRRTQEPLNNLCARSFSSSLWISSSSRTTSPRRKIHRMASENASAPTKQPLSPTVLSTVEASKRAAAYKAVEDHFDPSYKFIGIGSGSTVVYVVEAIAAQGPEVTNKMLFIPTGDQSKQLILEAHLPLGSIDSLPPTQDAPYNVKSGVLVATGQQDMAHLGKRESLDVAFDGADEIDDDLNCIKGGGACLLQEKLVATSAKKFICVADFRKLQRRLLTGWKAIPIEITPLSASTIKRRLITLGSLNPQIRQGGSAKAGPVVTDNGQWIIDAPFPPLLLASELKEGVKGDGTNGDWEVGQLGKKLKSLVGVLEVGLFHGRNGQQVAAAGEEGGGQKPIAAYFGMEDGSVEIRVAEV